MPTDPGRSVRLTSWKKWVFGIHSWRFVTFPVAVAAAVFLARTSPYSSIRAVGWVLALGYALAFVLVLMGQLRLPER